MIEYWDFWNYGYEPPQGGMGMASTCPDSPERDLVAELHEVVTEVTGKPSAPKPKPRIGFV